MPWVDGGLDERGRVILEYEEEPQDERWRDQTCFLCGRRESWFRCLMAYDMAFCSECLPDTHDLGALNETHETIVLQLLVRRLWKASYVRRS